MIGPCLICCRSGLDLKPIWDRSGFDQDCDRGKGGDTLVTEKTGWLTEEHKLLRHTDANDLRERACEPNINRTVCERVK